ncbi:MAG: SpaA isopeptide-forming pilin-related protein [Marinifilaceae bacterium]
MRQIKITICAAITLLCISLTIITGCSKTEYVDVDVKPQLEITVTDVSGKPVEGATTSLFSSKEDWEKKSNNIQSKKTDAAGKVLFEGLNETVYYFFVEKNTLNNFYEIASIENPLSKNEIKIITCVIR